MKSQYAGGLGGWVASWENEMLKEGVLTGRKTNWQQKN
jgi:hypothetical protein